MFRRYWPYVLILLFQSGGFHGVIDAMTFIAADNPSIQYFGRWDMTDPLRPRYSWPGVYICAEFRGTRIGVRLLDTTDYFNVYIDGALHGVFHGSRRGGPDYIVADSLQEGRHSFRFSRRNITFEEPYTFCGLLLGEGGEILPPAAPPLRKMEFIGDSFTAAESDEATVQALDWEARYPVTNIDAGFAPLIAKHFGAQYHTTCRSGSGMYCDWQGNLNQTIPARFDRTLMESVQPKWDFAKWVPDVVVVCLGLNDYSGLKDSAGNVTEKKSALFRSGRTGNFWAHYGPFIPGSGSSRSLHPNSGYAITSGRWLMRSGKRGDRTISYARFDRFSGGYVAYGHPTVETHARMAEQLISQMEAFHLFREQGE
jgi:hypothetical protein